jgi:hypothetical protein
MPRLGRRPISELTRQDIAKLHHELASTPYQANRTLTLLSKFFKIGPRSTALAPMAPIPAGTSRNTARDGASAS